MSYLNTDSAPAKLRLYDFRAHPFLRRLMTGVCHLYREGRLPKRAVHIIHPSLLESCLPVRPILDMLHSRGADSGQGDTIATADDTHFR